MRYIMAEIEASNPYATEPRFFKVFFETEETVDCDMVLSELKRLHGLDIVYPEYDGSWMDAYEELQKAMEKDRIYKSIMLTPSMQYVGHGKITISQIKFQKV